MGRDSKYSRKCLFTRYSDRLLGPLAIFYPYPFMREGASRTDGVMPEIGPKAQDGNKSVAADEGPRAVLWWSMKRWWLGDEDSNLAP